MGELTGVDDEAPRPPVVDPGDAKVGTALAAGGVVALPGVGGYCLAVRVGTPAEARMVALAADPDGPHYAVGQRDDVRPLTSGWTDEVARLLDRIWPGPVDVFLPRAVADAGPGEERDGADDTDGADAADTADTADTADAADAAEAGGNGTGESPAVSEPAHADSGGWAVTVGMPDGRALRRLCKEHGPWRTIPLNYNEATEVANAFDVADVALVVDGGRRDGEPPTLVDATVSPVRVLREGALPSNFVDATVAMGSRKRWFGRSKSKGD